MHGRQLWSTDGTSSGTFLAADFTLPRDRLGYAGFGALEDSNPTFLAKAFGKYLYFSADGVRNVSSGGVEQWELAPQSRIWLFNGSSSSLVCMTWFILILRGLHEVCIHEDSNATRFCASIW